MRAFFVLAFSLLAGAFRVPALAPRAPHRAPLPSASAAATASTRSLYALIEDKLRRARLPEAPAIGQRTARTLANRWMDIAPEALVESTLIAGKLVLDDFDEGLAILIEAEDVAALNVSGRAYSALMRLAEAEGRHKETLALLARTRAYGVERTDGLLLGGMHAATALEDWGAVARLYAELSDGAEAAANCAADLESIYMNEGAAAGGGECELPGRGGADAPPSHAELAQALTLALRAHCERGDVCRAVVVVERMRARGAALTAADYTELARLASRSKRVQPLLALRPADVARSLEMGVQPRVFEATSRVGLLAASLGRVERAIAAALALAVLLGGAVALTGGLDVAGSAPSAAQATSEMDQFDFDFSQF